MRGTNAQSQQALQELDAIIAKQQGEELVAPRMVPTAQLDLEPMEDLPEARSTGTVGVKFLQEQLDSLRDFDKVQKADPYELQRELEQQGYDVALQRLLHMKESSVERGDKLAAMNLTPLRQIMWDWHQQTVPLIREEVERVKNLSIKEAERQPHTALLQVLPPEKLAMITMLELLRLHNSSGIADGMKTARAVIDVGKAVEMEYNAVQMKRSGKSVARNNQELHSLFSSGKLFNMAVRKVYEKQAASQASLSHMVESAEGDTGMHGDGLTWVPVWPSATRAKVGGILTSIFIESAKIPQRSWDPETGEKMQVFIKCVLESFRLTCVFYSMEAIPAFFHTYQYVKGKRVGVIKFSEPLTNLLSREPVRETLHPRLLPMIVHPQPWIRHDSGGYLTAKSSCMRIKDSPEQLLYLDKACKEGKLTTVLAGLDVLGSTKWRVNKKVFKTILEVWNQGEPLASIPRAIEHKAELPEKPPNFDTDPKAKFRWVTEVKAIQTKEKNEHSIRCDVNYKVETARRVSDS